MRVLTFPLQTLPEAAHEGVLVINVGLNCGRLYARDKSGVFFDER